MNKNIVIVIIVGVIGFSIACLFVLEIMLEDNKDNSSYSNDFIGVWNATIQSKDEFNPFTYNYLWTFYDNETAYFQTLFINETITEPLARWGSFEVTESKLIIEAEKEEDKPIEYLYSFSEDKNKIVFSLPDGTITFYKKQ